MTTATQAVTKEELANLSDEERAAIEENDEDGQLSQDDLEALREIASEGDQDEEGKGDETERPRLPRLEVRPVEKFDEQMKTLDTEYDAALAKFKEGDLSIEELLAKQRELDGKRYDLRSAKDKAEMAADFNDQTGRAEWMGEVQDFFAQVKREEGVDYTKQSMNVALDHALKALAADPANGARSSQWFLRQAHRLVQADLADLERGGDAGRQDSGGEDDAGGDSEFAAIDELEGEEYEAALVRMSPAKQERYLRQRG